MRNYIALFELDKENKTVGVVFPDLPGCFSSGKDFDEAYLNAHEAVSLYAQEIKNMPEPRSLEQIKDTWDDWKEWSQNKNIIVSSITYIPASKHKKYTIYIDSSIMDRIDRISKNRSSFLTDAALALLENKITC